MNSTKLVAKCLSDLAVLWSQSGLRLDDNGHCSLRTDDHLDILLEVKDDMDELLFVGDLGTSLDEKQAAKLFHENMFASQIRFASYAREFTTGKIFLRYHYPVHALDENKLGALLSNFIETVRWAQEVVKNIASGKEVRRYAERSPNVNGSKKYFSGQLFSNAKTNDN